MVHHVIGRKHRQKYVETVRADLVTWDRESLSTQGGRVIRAKAVIIERQDGRGSPTPLAKTAKQGKFYNSKGLPRQRQSRDRTIEPIPQGQVAPLLPGLKNYQNKYSNQRKYPSDEQNKPGFQPEDPNMRRGRRRQWEDDPGDDEPRRSHMYRDNFRGPDHLALNKFGKDLLVRAAFELGEPVPVRDVRERMPSDEYYPETETPYERSYSERGAPDEFYSEGSVREQILSLNYNPEEEKQHWSREREPGRHDDIYRAARQEFSEPEAKRRSFSPSPNSDHAGNSFSLVRDYHHERGLFHREEANEYTHPDGAGASIGQLDVGRGIPEPFRRFLTGDTEENLGKRKRKSRFSDATQEELEMTKEMFNADDSCHSPWLDGDHGAPSRHESGRMQYSDSYRGSEYAESYQRGGSNSDGVFDVLRDIEIENEEQADFLKSKLCGLLREFKSKKMEQESQSSQNQPGSFRNYSDSTLEPQLPRHSLYERTLSQDMDHRETPRDRREHRPDEQHQGYPHLPHAEHRLSARSRYEGMFKKAHGSHLDEPPYYPERFQEPPRSHDYQPAVKEFYDSSPPMEQGSRMNRGPRHSNSLDKIASTLLELVSKK
ncbi:unnamed protein product [Ophioblennius macclurei]